jgi:tRNA pseudouridine13 synthase
LFNVWLTRWMTPEFEVLNVLRKGNEGVTSVTNALDAIPRSMRMLYVHAYQSFVWNNMASQRLAKGGTAVLVGDLVLCATEDQEDTEGKAGKGDAIEEEVKEVKEVKEDEEGDVVMKEEASKNPFKNEKKPARKKKEGFRGLPKVHAVTEADLGQYTVYDVVLPLPGVASVYPSNMLAEYHAFLKEDNTYDTFFSAASSSSSSSSSSTTTAAASTTYDAYHLEGGYRHLLRRVETAEAKVLDYFMDDQQIQATDRNRINGDFTPYSGTEGCIGTLGEGLGVFVTVGG